MTFYNLLSKYGFSTALILAAIASIISLISVDASVYSMYFFVTVATVSAVVLPLVNAFDNPKVLLKTGIGVGGLLILFLISWGASSENDVETILATKSQIKLAGALLNMMWVLLITALLSIIGTEVYNVIRK